MSKQVILWHNKVALSTTAIAYTSINSGQTWFATETDGTQPWSVSGKFSNLEVTVGTAPGVGNSRTFAVRINGADTALTVTISGTDTVGRLVGTSVNVSQWDLVSIKATPTSTPDATSEVFLSVDFDSTTPGEQCYGLASGQPIAATRTNRLFFGVEATNWSATNSSDVASIAGVIGGYGVSITTTIATGTWTFVIFKNGVEQNGGGGTVDTTLVFDSGTPLEQQVTFSLPVAAGDIFQFQCQETVAATALNGVAFGVLFTADVPGQFMLGASSNGNLSSTVTLYSRLTGGNASAMNATESLVQVKAGITSFFLSAFRAQLNDVATSYTFTLRKNASGTSITATITGTTSGSDLTHKVLCKNGDLLAIETVPIGSPTVRVLGYSFGATAQPGKSAKAKGKGGGGVNEISPGGTILLNIGNPGVSIN